MLQYLRNAEIRTMHAGMPRAEAAVIEGGRFAFVGSERGAHMFLAGRTHTEVDAGGGTVIPGLNDAHLHYVHTAMRRTRVDLVGTRSIEEMQARLRAGLADLAGQWLIADGWNQEQFAQRRLPTREDLDLVSADVPIVASRACGHIMTANSRAMALAGVDVADGIFREDEQDAIFARMPSPGLEEILEAMIQTQSLLYAQGITSIQSDDIGGMDTRKAEAFMLAVRDAGDMGMLRVRYALQALRGDRQTLQPFLEEGLHGLRGDRFQVSCIKLLTDGSLGARTAWMQNPYADAPDTKGIALYSDADLHALVREASRHRVPAAIHAIGDAAMQQTLDAFEAEGQGLRHAVVHAQICDASQAIRCGRLGLSILAQPIFLDADAPIVRSRVGDSLADTSYRWRTMLGAGAHVAFSTDCPVEPFDPMPNLYAAVTRHGVGSDTAYLPDEAFTLDEALYAYTAAGAYVSGDEVWKGCIWPGMAADFAILDGRLADGEPERLLHTKVAHTFIEGECVYSK